MTDFFELLKTRRSVRIYEDKEVPPDLIKEIINDSILAPSASHNQPWRFIIINNRDMMKRISDESKKNLLEDIYSDPEGPGSRYATILKNKDFNVFYSAPCLVIVCGPRNVISLDVDCALAASYFMFSATSRGLGTCWVNLGSHIKDPELLKEIGLTEDLRIIAPIIIGYPKFIPKIPPRNEPQILKIVS